MPTLKDRRQHRQPSQWPAPSPTRQKHRRSRSDLDTLDAVVVALDADGRIAYINQKGCRLLGHRLEDIMGQAWHHSLLNQPEEAKSACPCFLPMAPLESSRAHALKKTGITTSTDLPREIWNQRVLRDEQEVEALVEKRTAELRKANQRLEKEIEDRKRIEEELAAQKDFLNTLLETISNPVFYKDEKGKYLGCNRAFEEFIGKPRSEIINKTVYDMGPTDIVEKYHQKDMELFTTPGKQHYEWKIKGNDGELRDVIFDKATLLDNIGNITGLVGVISDITDRKQAEDLVRDLSQLLLNAQENERKRISYELHDSIAQSLSSLKILCDTFFDGHSSITPEFKKKMRAQSHMIGQIIHSVRNLSYGLHPPALSQMGLIQAVAQLCDDFRKQTGLMVNYTTAGIRGRNITETLAINLYRLVQEGLNNIRKHANARHVTVNLLAAHPNLILRIEDDGKGFDPHKCRDLLILKKKMGLRSMKERVHLLQGTMKITSMPTKGTKILIRIPFANNGSND